MAAWHGTSPGVFMDQRFDLPGLIGPGAVDPGPHSCQQNKSCRRNNDRNKKLPAFTARRKLYEKGRVCRIHNAGRGFPGCTQQKTGRTAFADAACELLIKITVILKFHNVYLWPLPAGTHLIVDPQPEDLRAGP